MNPSDTTIDNNDIPNKHSPVSFSMKQKGNLALLVFAYAFLMSSLSLVVGTSSLEVVFLGSEIGDNVDVTDIAPIAFALFMLGTAFISLITTYLFHLRGRKLGFIIGNLLGIIGAILGASAVWMESIPLLMFSYVPLGASNGIGNYIRFAAVEVVPPHYEALAVTLVLSGGVISAFMGPEAADVVELISVHQQYLYIFVVLAVFNVIMALMISLVDFPTSSSPQSSSDATNAIAFERPDAEKSNGNSPQADVTFTSKFKSHQFWIPALLASLSWVIMTMPMSVARVAMEDQGFTPRQSLTVIEAHFLGMFSPGFVSGQIIKNRGNIFSLCLTIVLFGIGFVFNLISQSIENGGTILTWAFGLFFMGAAWNFGYALSTVWLERTYIDCPQLKPKLQAMNDFIMFFFTGIMIISAGYIYKSAELMFGQNGQLQAWRVLNYVALGFVAILIIIVLFVIRNAVKQNSTSNKHTSSNIEGNIELPENGEYA